MYLEFQNKHGFSPSGNPGPYPSFLKYASGFGSIPPIRIHNPGLNVVYYMKLPSVLFYALSTMIIYLLTKILSKRSTSICFFTWNIFSIQFFRFKKAFEASLWVCWSMLHVIIFVWLKYFEDWLHFNFIDLTYDMRTS